MPVRHSVSRKKKRRHASKKIVGHNYLEVPRGPLYIKVLFVRIHIKKPLRCILQINELEQFNVFMRDFQRKITHSLFGCHRGKSLLELWVTTFLPD